jgi:transcriptional regulator with XRE-family HTH domain
MEPKASSKRRDYTKLGNYLRQAREQLRDEHGDRRLGVQDMAKYLGVTRGFVYQVEEGRRKPKNGLLANWASVYSVPYVELCKRLGIIPLDLVAAYREEQKPASGPILVDPFSQLTEEEKSELRPFLDFVRWKIAHPAARGR